MLSASKHGDPQLGLDIHLYTTPAGPVPMPAMHISLVFDPFDYLPFIGSTVKVSGMQRATAGTGGLAIHIPFGFPFAPALPERDDEVFMGSSTVLADGEPMTYQLLPVLGCQIVGMPSPGRKKKKKAPSPTLLPTTINLAIPTNVLVGGTPTVSLLSLGIAAALKGLGKLRRSKLGKNFGDRFKKFRQKLFKNMEPGFLKCKVLRAEPVNLLSGEVEVEQRDFKLEGFIPLDWVRRYKSGSRRKGACGYGWESTADIRLEIDPQDDSITFIHPTDGPALFPQAPQALGDAGTVLELMDGAQLSDHGTELRVLTKADLIYHFSKATQRAGHEGVYEMPLARISDLCGNGLEFEHRGGRLAAITDSSGRRVVLTHEEGLIRSISLFVPATGFSHRFAEYDYDRADNLTAVRDALGNPHTFDYDRHHLVRHTNRRGLSFHYEYDKTEENWQVVRAWGDDGLYDYRFAYLPALRERRITDSRGFVWTVQLNEFDLPILQIDPLGGRTIYEYDDSGRTTAIVDAANHRVEYRYDERGNLLAVTRPDGAAIETAFNHQNKPTTLTDPNGNTWQQTWDERGRLSEQRSPLGAVTRYEYSSSGLLLAKTDANGATTRLAYDSNAYLISVTSALGITGRLLRDELGNILSATDELGRTTTYRYDVKSRLIEATPPSGSTVHCGYDALDLLTRYVDENGAETRFEYFGQGHLSKRHEPNGTVLEYQYDTEEQLIGIVNQRGERYELKRDAAGRVMQEVDYWGQSTRYTFDIAGYLQQSIDPLGRTIDYKTDVLGRVRRKSYAHPDFPDQPDRRCTETFEFDANGNLTACANEHSKVQRVFDPENRMIEERQNSFCIKNTYDPLGRRIRRETPNHTVAYGYDAIGQVSMVRIDNEPPVSIERDAAGQVVKETLGATLERHFQYDSLGRLTTQGVKRAPGWLFQTRYQYDATGNLTERQDSQLGVDRYRYDPLGQIIEHIDPRGQLTRFFNDPAGDRLGTQVRNSATGANDWSREGRYEGMLYRFDRAGHLVERSQDSSPAPQAPLTLTWDANQRLVRSASGGIETSYGYDPLGRRVFKRTGSDCQWFGWDDDWIVAEGATELLKREFVYYPDTFVPLALVDETGSYYYHNDPNGCPTRLTRADGTVVWSASYDVWGKALVQIEQIANPLRLQGQYADAETGFHYNRYRYYDPVAGQFISQDPAWVLSSGNLYAFAPNAFAWIDPWGLATVDAAFRMAGQLFEGVNPTERSPRVSGPTLPGLGVPNNNRFSMHAEFDAMMQAYDQGLRGGVGILTVEGQELCPFCLRHVKNMARHLDLDYFIIHERATGQTYTFTRKQLLAIRKGGKGFKGRGIPNPGGCSL